MDKKKYPIGPEHYTLIEEVGQGGCASVHRALCVPFDEVVAIKILDFERDNSDLNKISREAQTMILVDHPNVLKSHCSFVSDHNLWVVMPFMSGGSCLHMLKVAYPDGFEEVVIATILREVLKGLEYLHHHGHIHRDVKAGNILIGARGTIKLGDFGVSACLFDSGDRQRMRNTFVGTPCWMAPEVMEQLHGYDFKADIWSFGITALELAHGHAPFSKYPPMKVLLMTLQNAPPGLDYERDRKFSKSFKQMIASCLVKDPTKRPIAKKLLKHSFFKQARSSDYISRVILEGLPDLGDRLKALKEKEEDMLAQKKMPDGEKEELSQNEYKRGISGWNFNLEDVKAQASLIQDGEETIAENGLGGSSNSLSGLEHEKHLQSQFSSVCHLPQLLEVDDNDRTRNLPDPLPSVDLNLNTRVEKWEISEDDTASPTYECYLSQTSSPTDNGPSESSLVDKPDVEINDLERKIRGISGIESSSPESSTSAVNCERDNGASAPPEADNAPPEAISGVPRSSSANTDEIDDKGKGPVVQQRGRFKVTSENVELEKATPSPMLQKSHSMQVISQHPAMSLPSPPSFDATSSNHSANSFYPLLQHVLQTNINQRDIILSMMKQIATNDSTVNRDGGWIPPYTNVTEKSSLEVAHDREKELLTQVTDLQSRLMSVQEELKKYKSENAQV